MLTLSLTSARRLSIARQGLDGGTRAKPDARAMLDLVRQIGCLQLDPTSAVARSHLLVLWSRLGVFDSADLDHLLWNERHLFEYWAHAASIVLTEDYPIHHHQMRSYRASTSNWGQRVRKWVEENRVLRDHILSEIRANGPLPSKYFEDKSEADWYSSGWTSRRNVSQMLGYLWDVGEILVATRKSGHRYWDLAERCLPEWTPRDELPTREVVRLAAQKSLRALGVGTLRQIQQHYTRSRYPGLPQVMVELEREGLVQQVAVVREGKALTGNWYIHRDDLALLDQIEASEPLPRTTLLSPFDNLICDRARTELLWDFDYRIEIYVPKDKRKYGYFVLPILHGERLIGRIDPLMDRRSKTLHVHNVYAEADAPLNGETGRAVVGAIESLAGFLGAERIAYGENIPKGWKGAFRD